MDHHRAWRRVCRQPGESSDVVRKLVRQDSSCHLIINLRKIDEAPISACDPADGLRRKRW